MNEPTPKQLDRASRLTGKHGAYHVRLEGAFLILEGPSNLYMDNDLSRCGRKVKGAWRIPASRARYLGKILSRIPKYTLRLERERLMEKAEPARQARLRKTEYPDIDAHLHALDSLHDEQLETVIALMRQEYKHLQFSLEGERPYTRLCLLLPPIREVTRQVRKKGFRLRGGLWKCPLHEGIDLTVEEALALDHLISEAAR